MIYVLQTIVKPTYKVFLYGHAPCSHLTEQTLGKLSRNRGQKVLFSFIHYHLRAFRAFSGLVVCLVSLKSIGFTSPFTTA